MMTKFGSLVILLSITLLFSCNNNGSHRNKSARIIQISNEAVVSELKNLYSKDSLGGNNDQIKDLSLAIEEAVNIIDEIITALEKYSSEEGKEAYRDFGKGYRELDNGNDENVTVMVLRLKPYNKVLEESIDKILAQIDKQSANDKLKQISRNIVKKDFSELYKQVEWYKGLTACEAISVLTLLKRDIILAEMLWHDHANQN